MCLKKLKIYGIRGITDKWFKLCLKDKKQNLPPKLGSNEIHQTFKDVTCI